MPSLIRWVPLDHDVARSRRAVALDAQLHQRRALRVSTVALPFTVTNG